MLVHTKAFLYEALINVMTSLLLDLLHRVFDLVGSPRPTGQLQSKPLTRAVVDQSPPLWRPAGTKKPTKVGLCVGTDLTNAPLCADVKSMQTPPKNRIFYPSFLLQRASGTQVVTRQ